MALLHRFIAFEVRAIGFELSHEFFCSPADTLRLLVCLKVLFFWFFAWVGGRFFSLVNIIAIRV